MDEQTRQKYAVVIKWGLGFVGAVIISPFVFLAVKGIIGLALALAVAFVAVEFAPVFAMKVMNLKIQAITDEATENPIPTMKAVYLEKSKELDQKKQDIIAFDTEIRNFKAKLKTVLAQYPDEAADYQQLATDEEAALQQMKDQYTESADDLDQLQRDIDKAETLYSLALSALRVTSLNKSQEAQFVQQLKQKVAFGAVTSKLNESMAALNASVNDRRSRGLQLPARKATTALPPHVVDAEIVPATKQREAVGVARK